MKRHMNTFGEKVVDLILNELKTYPELKTFTLVNLLTNQEHTVTEEQLKAAFSDNEINKMKTNRSKAFLVYENNLT